jgi:hypothetical protein
LILGFLANKKALIDFQSFPGSFPVLSSLPVLWYFPPMTESKSIEHWYFKERSELLANSNFNDTKKEILFRREYISFATQLCEKLSSHPIVTCTSLLLMHRVLLRWHSKYDTAPAVSDLSATMVFIGCKVEESLRHLNQILSHVLALKDQQRIKESKSSDQKKEEIGEDTDEISGLKERIFDMERKVLVLLCFDFSVDNPYRHISRFFKSIAQTTDKSGEEKKTEAEKDDAKGWRQVTLERMNESFSSLIHLEFSERHIAAACILHSRSYRDLPLDKDWIQPFKLDSTVVLTRINNSIDKDLDLLKELKG